LNVLLRTSEHMVKVDFIEKGATISKNRKYRYRLWRIWQDKTPLRKVLFVMLNPSIADGEILDPTIRRCIGFAKAWGFDGLEVANLFALRATDPKQLYTIEDPIGAENYAAIIEAAKQSVLIVAAWGDRGRLKNQDELVTNMITDFSDLYCLGVTKKGAPRHPLYLPNESVNVLYRPRKIS
jgi:hypothetical protein